MPARRHALPMQNHYTLSISAHTWCCVNMINTVVGGGISIIACLVRHRRDRWRSPSPCSPCATTPRTKRRQGGARDHGHHALVAHELPALAVALDVPVAPEPAHAGRRPQGQVHTHALHAGWLKHNSGKTGIVGLYPVDQAECLYLSNQVFNDYFE